MQVPEQLALLMQLLAIAPAKLHPASWVVPKPFAKLSAGRDIFHPFIQGGISLGHAARPQPVNQDACTIPSFNGFIGSFQPNIGCRDVLGHRALLETLTNYQSATRFYSPTRERERPETGFATALCEMLINMARLRLLKKLFGLP
jgi:hypothetical protein